MKKRILACVLAIALTLLCCGCSSNKDNGKVTLNPNKPVLLTVWTYYNGAQQETFDNLVKSFNDTVGAKMGICVEARSKGSVTELSDAVYASANHEVGSEELPDIFGSYADTAYGIDEMGLLADMSPYFTEEERAEYVDAYIQEGYLTKDGGLKVFPIAKSTEIFLLNETAWAEFEAETGADKSKLSTWEGLAEISKQYYEWTDAKTPEIEGDGKTFFGRDAFANYMLVGSKQLGKELFPAEDGKMTPQFDREVLKRLWENYYVPYVNGWYGAFGHFRSDDIKTGQIIALVGSTSAALYFPNEVTDDNGNSHPIECGVYTLPNFEGTEPYAVQQGAGMVVTKSTPEEEYAATVFLKWLTEVDHNVVLSLGSGYLPVKKAANDPEVVLKAIGDKGTGSLLPMIVNVGLEITNNYTLYTTKPFEGGNAARKVADTHMPNAAAAAVEARDAAIAAGESREEVLERLTNEDAFDAWATDFESAVLEALGK